MMVVMMMKALVKVVAGVEVMMEEEEVMERVVWNGEH